MTVHSFPSYEAAHAAKWRYIRQLPQGYTVTIHEDRATIRGPFYLNCVPGPEQPEVN